MIITDKFVMLNFPKTGSTFVQKVLKGIAEKDRWKKRYTFGLGSLSFKEFQILQLPNIRVSDGRQGTLDQHGIYDQIPLDHLSKEVVSVVRNPFRSLVSRFLFNTWKWRNCMPKEELMDAFPHFPDLSFQEFLHYKYIYELPYRFPQLKKGSDIGPLSTFFALFFFKGHDKGLKDLDLEMVESRVYERYMPEIKFLRTEDLNRELYEFLIEKGLDKKKLAHIEKMGKENQSSLGKDPRDFFDYHSFSFVKERERMLFQLFPEYLQEFEQEKVEN